MWNQSFSADRVAVNRGSVAYDGTCSAMEIGSAPERRLFKGSNRSYVDCTGVRLLVVSRLVGTPMGRTDAIKSWVFSWAENRTRSKVSEISG